MTERQPTFHLRPTEVTDLDAVLAIEQHPENEPFIGQWSRQDHAAVIQSATREHWILARGSDRTARGYIIAYDLVREGFGVYVKRIVVSDKSVGIGRAALYSFLQDAFRRRDADSACLVVLRNNERAQRSYRSIGFIEIQLTTSEHTTLQTVDRFPEDRVVVMRVQSTTLRAP